MFTPGVMWMQLVMQGRVRTLLQLLYQKGCESLL